MLRVNGPRAQPVYTVSTEDADSTVVSYRMNPPTGRSGDKINPKIRAQKIRGQEIQKIRAHTDLELLEC
jgi:hypothetical protein